MAWFEAEHRVLLAVIALAVRAGFDTRLPAVRAKLRRPDAGETPRTGN